LKLEIRNWKFDEDQKTKDKEQRTNHLRMFNELSEKIDAAPNMKIVTCWDTTKWEEVESIGECPLIKGVIPECSIFFAAKYWISPENQEAELWFGSDDAIEIRQNGKKNNNLCG